MRAASKRGPWFVGVTLGPGGALAYVHGEFHYVAAYRVPVVDSTGAGDIFHAGSIYGLLQGWSAPDTLRFAAAAAALKCEKLGGRPGIPTLECAEDARWDSLNRVVPPRGDSVPALVAAVLHCSRIVRT